MQQKTEEIPIESILCFFARTAPENRQKSANHVTNRKQNSYKPVKNIAKIMQVPLAKTSSTWYSITVFYDDTVLRIPILHMWTEKEKTT